MVGLTVTGAYLLTEYFGHTLAHGHDAALWTGAGAVLVLLNHNFLKGYQCLLLALVQGLLMLLDVPLGRQHEAQNK